MLTQDDLAAIGGLLESRLRPIDKKLETIEKTMVTKSDLSANNRIFGTIVRAELAETNKRIETIAAAMKAGFQEVVKHSKKMEQKRDDHENRITQLEEDSKFLPH